MTRDIYMKVWEWKLRLDYEKDLHEFIRDLVFESIEEKWSVYCPCIECKYYRKWGKWNV